VQVSEKGNYLSKNAVNQTLGLAVMWIYASLSGCSAGPPASASISQSRLITLYEGLPHQFYEPKALLAEKKAKQTVELNGFTFYGETLELKAGDAEELKALLAGSRSFVPFTEEKKCGGFHPDYAVEWSVGGETYRCLICLGCLEARIHGPGGVTEYDIENAAFKRLKQLLVPYRKNRPAASQELFLE
jgi:hypothetical protein